MFLHCVFTLFTVNNITLLPCLNISMLSHCTCSSTKQAPLTEPLHTDHTSFSLAYCSTITLNFFLLLKNTRLTLSLARFWSIIFADHLCRTYSSGLDMAITSFRKPSPTLQTYDGHSFHVSCGHLHCRVYQFWLYLQTGKGGVT